MNAPSFILREPEADYHARSRTGECLSSHLLNTFRWSPLKYSLRIRGLLPDPPSEALDFGRAAHCMILEGLDAFNASYVVGDGPTNPKTGLPYGTATKAYQEWKAAQAVRRHPVASALLSPDRYIPEAVIRTPMNDSLCQIRMDAYLDNGDIVDLKTTGDLAGFFWDIARPGYDYVYQAAFYRSVLRVASGKTGHFYFVAVEKQYPYTVGVWHMSPDVLDQAEGDNAVKMRALADCRQKDVWPSGYEDLREYDKMLF